MQQKWLGLLFFCVLIPNIIVAQFNQWQTIFSPFQTTSLVRYQNVVYAGTESGLIWFPESKPEETHFVSKENGLSSVGITNLLLDSLRRQLVITFSNGDLQLMNLSNNQFQTIPDIRLYQLYNNKTLTIAKINNNWLWMGTPFGIVVYNLQSNIFEFDLSNIQTYSNLNVTDFAFMNDSVFVATAFGLFCSPLSNLNFKNPSSWQKIDVVTGNLTSLCTYNEKIWIGTTNGLKVYNNGTCQTVNAFPSVEIKKMIVQQRHNQPDRLLVLTVNKLLELNIDLTNSELITTINKPNNILSYAENIYVSTNESGVIEYNGLTSSTLPLKGIYSNSFRTFEVENNGSFFGASGILGKPSTYFDSIDYHRIDESIDPSLTIYQQMTAKKINNKWLLGTWGTGLFIFDEQFQFQHIGTNNSNFVGISVDPTYLVIVDIDEGQNGDILFTCYAPSDNKPLRLKRKNNSWNETVGLGFQDRLFGAHWFDSQFYHWVTLLDQSAVKKGLLVIDDNGTPENASDDRTVQINTSTGLPSDDVTDIVFDKNGSAWIATSNGLSVIYNAYYIFSSDNISIAPVYSIENQNISSLTMDANGNIWAATANGVQVISSENQKIIHVYNEQNSGLLSNNVRKLIYQPNTGKVFALTTYGISVFQTTSIQAAKQVEQPYIYPNPFLLEKNRGVWIEGLSIQSKIKIIASDGQVVRSLVETGSKIGFWDGRNDKGDKVSSGIYLIYLMDKENNSASIGKVLVIK